MPFGLTFTFSSPFFFSFSHFFFLNLQYVDKNKKKNKPKLFPIEINSKVPMATHAWPNSTVPCCLY